MKFKIFLTTTLILLLIISILVYCKTIWIVEIEKYESSRGWEIAKPVFLYENPSEKEKGIIAYTYFLQWRKWKWALFMIDPGVLILYVDPYINITNLLEGNGTTYFIYNYKDKTYSEKIYENTIVYVSKFNSTCIQFNTYYNNVKNSTYLLCLDSKILAYTYGYNRVLIVSNASKYILTRTYPLQVTVITLPKEQGIVHFFKFKFNVKKIEFKIAIINYTKYVYVEVGKKFNVSIWIQNIGTIPGKVNIVLKDWKGNIHDKKEKIEINVNEVKKITLTGIAPSTPGVYEYIIAIYNSETGNLMGSIVINIEVPKRGIEIPTIVIAIIIIIIILVITYLILERMKK